MRMIFNSYFFIPNLEIFWCCQCHLVAQDGSTEKEHLHALQYQKCTHMAIKKRMQRAGLKFHSKTTFKPIICADYAVAVLGYLVNLTYITVDPFTIQMCYILVSRHRIMDVVTGEVR